MVQTVKIQVILRMSGDDLHQRLDDLMIGLVSRGQREENLKEEVQKL